MVKSRTLLPIILAWLCVSPTNAQLEGILKPSDVAEAAKPKPSLEIREQLEVWKKDVADGLARLAKITGVEQLPPGVTLTNLSTRRRYLEQAQLAINRHLLILDDIKDAKAALEAARAASEAWKGYGDDAPKSILAVDELVNRKEAIEGKLASNRSSLDVFETTLASLVKDSKAAEERIAAALKAVEEGPNDPVAPWKLDTEKARQRSIFIRASALKYGISSLKDTIKAAEIELALLSKKIREAGKSAVFTEEDLQRIRVASDDRQAELRKETLAAKKLQGKAISDQATAAAKLAELRKAENPDPIELEIAQLTLEAADIRLKSLQTMVDSLESFEQIEAFVPEVYEHRFKLLGSKSKSERKEALEALIDLNQRLSAWEIVARNELASVAADISKEESRASTYPADDPRLIPLNRLRTVLWEKQALIQRAYQSVSGQRRVIARWIADDSDGLKAAWYAPATDIFLRSREAAKRLWNVPVNRYEETIEIDGQTVVQVRFVSLGTIVTAVLLFIAAYFIAAKISGRLQHMLVHRRMIGENQARTLRNWLMLVVAMLLAVATLSWLSIPLTIFAFLAGALAIGVGFGTQTIIRNFISGIILLFERKVRVGDIIEVDGIHGVVSEINTRSSIVRGVNGIENLIPNSLLLENRVVNWTLNTRSIRRELKLGVAYGSPTQKAMEILNEAAERHGLILKEPPPFSAFSNFGDNSLDFTLYFWIDLNDKTNALVVESDLRIMIEKRLTELGIGIPFPQRDVSLSSSRPLQVELSRRGAEKIPDDGEKEPFLP